MMPVWRNPHRLFSFWSQYLQLRSLEWGKQFKKNVRIGGNRSLSERWFHELVWIFTFGSILGNLGETLYCRWRTGKWMNRSSVVIGPFNIVWGGAFVLATVFLTQYAEYSKGRIFIMGALLGGVFEYLCSVFTEKVFGKVFWDYSDIPYNINGRINALYCVFWGIAAVVWVKGLYPDLASGIEWMLGFSKSAPLTNQLFIFIILDIALSYLALKRSEERSRGISAECKWQRDMDHYFGDEKLAQIYPNMTDATTETMELGTSRSCRTTD